MRADTLACSYSYHSQPFYQDVPNGLTTYLFRLQTEGSCYALIEGSMQRIEAGDLIVFKPGEPYRLDIGAHINAGVEEVASADYHLFCLGDWIDQWWLKRSRGQKFRIDLDDKAVALWRMLTLEKRKLEGEHRDLCEYLLKALLISLDQASSTGSPYEGKSYIASRMMRFVEKHATTPFTLEALASEVGLSVSRAVHLFKECYDKTIIQHTLDIRLAIAEERLKYSEMSLEQVAETSGFGSYSYFFRIFKRKFGMSPSLYKQRLQQEFMQH